MLQASFSLASRAQDASTLAGDYYAAPTRMMGARRDDKRACRSYISGDDYYISRVSAAY